MGRQDGKITKKASRLNAGTATKLFQDGFPVEEGEWHLLLINFVLLIIRVARDL